MMNIQEIERLQEQIVKIVNKVPKGADKSDYQRFVLTILLYRIMSIKFNEYIKYEDEVIPYADYSDNNPKLTSELIKDTVKTLGYFIYPSQLFDNILKKAYTNPNIQLDLRDIFITIALSARGYPSEQIIKSLLTNFDLIYTQLGRTVANIHENIVTVMEDVANLDFKNVDLYNTTVLGNIYESLLHDYAARNGREGNYFFTPPSISKLLTRLALQGQSRINRIYDPAAGTGSLLLQVKKQFKDLIIEEGLFGQEKNCTFCDIARINMYLHNINYTKFNIAFSDSLTYPQFMDKVPFDAVVSNPPYSTSWIGSDDSTLVFDDRFAFAGAMPPKSKADFAFILHALHYLSNKGRAAIVCFPGALFRGGAEQKIRKYLVDRNYIETIIELPFNLFYGTMATFNILVLSKHKTDTKTQFINASGKGFYKKESNHNILENHHIDRIIKIFDRKENIDHIANSVDCETIADANYDLSVSNYV